MWDLLTVEDIFLAGAGFAIVGSVLLAWGLFPSRSQIRRLSATYWGANPEQREALTETKVAAWFGIVGLVAGFVCQVVGILCQVGIDLRVVAPSAARVLVGVGVTVGAGAITWAAYLLLRGPIVRRATAEDSNPSS